MKPGPAALLSGLFLILAHAAQPAEWVEVQSPHFRVVSDASEKRARDTAHELERIRVVFRNALPGMQQDPGLPIVVFAVRNEKGLRELLPEYWEREGPKPAGVFLRGSDNHYVVLRVDIGTDERYPMIYHEYFHLLLSLNTPFVPVWLNEGLAEFWGEARIRGGEVEMGLPSPGHLAFLQTKRMLPLQELLSMKANPHDSDPERVSVFYAEVWALTHMLMLGGPEVRKQREIGTYLDLVNGGADPVEAFVSAFGALAEMEKQLNRYVRQERMMGLRMDAPDKIDTRSFAGVELSEAGSAAERGRFLVSGARPEAALPLLERALALEPDSPLAIEAMGFYHFRRDEREQAKEWFAKAAALESGSFLCHFYLAQLLAEEGSGSLVQAKNELLRAIELNPRFAPAYAELGRLFALTGVRLESARAMAIRATELEPDNAWYWANLGRILLRMDLPQDAAAAADKARGVARSDDGALQVVDQFQRELNAYRRLSAVVDQNLRVEGRLVEMRCPGQGQPVELVVESEGRTLTVHTPSAQVLLEKGLSCGPQDAPVAVTYTPGVDENVDGELRVLEFLR